MIYNKKTEGLINYIKHITAASGVTDARIYYYNYIL